MLCITLCVSLSEMQRVMLFVNLLDMLCVSPLELMCVNLSIMLCEMLCVSPLHIFEVLKISFRGHATTTLTM